MNPLRSTAVAAALFFSLGTAGAVPLEFTFSGKVYAVTLFSGSTDTLGYTIGETATGRFIVDGHAPDQNPDPTVYFAPNSVSSFNFGSIASSSGFLQYSAVSIFPSAFSTYVNTTANPALPGILYSSDVFSFIASSYLGSTPLGHADLPNLTAQSFPINGTNFVFSRAWYLEGSPFSPQVSVVSMTVDSFTVTPVPEPSSYALMAAGLVTVGWAAKRRSVGVRKRLQPCA